MKAAVIGHKLTTKEYHKLYKEIYDALVSSGISVDFSYFDSTVDTDSADLQKAFKRSQNILKNSDFIVAETTLYSSGVGYMIAEALNNKKPVLALYNNKMGEKPSNIIRSSAINKLLSFKEYDSSTLKNTIDEFLKEVKNKLDTKFILIIPAEIDKYLEWAADQRRMHKAQIVRQAVEKVMEEDTEWQEVHLNL